MAETVPTYLELTQRWKALRSSRGIAVREVACIGAPRTLLCAEFGEIAQPVIHLSAGVHGDEPAGVLALIELVENDLLDLRFSYRIWPCTNPTGFDAGTRTSVDGLDINRTFGRGGSSPEAKAIVMANRDRKYVVAVDLHEDDEVVEPYIYAYGDTAAVVPPAISIECPDPHKEAELLGGLSLTLLLIRNATARGLTLESASGARLERRINWHRDTLLHVIRCLARVELED